QNLLYSYTINDLIFNPAYAAMAGPEYSWFTYFDNAAINHLSIDNLSTSYYPATGPVSVNEDAGPQIIQGFATNMAPGPATATDEAGQTLSFHVAAAGT